MRTSPAPAPRAAAVAGTGPYLTRDGDHRRPFGSPHGCAGSASASSFS